MLHRLILKVKKFQLPPPNRLVTVVKNMSGAIMPLPPPPMSDRVNVIHLRPVPVYRISTFVFLVLKVHFNQSRAFKFQNFGGKHALKGQKKSRPRSSENFLGLNSSSPLLAQFFDKKLRSGPSTESF